MASRKTGKDGTPATLREGYNNIPGPPPLSVGFETPGRAGYDKLPPPPPEPADKVKPPPQKK